MVKKIGFGLLGILVLSSMTVAWQAKNLSSVEILKRAEAQLSASSLIAEMDVSIIRPRWTKTMRMKVWSKGADYAMAYVMGPEKDKGTVYLKSKSEVYNYLPKIKKTIKLPAALLGQNWMGTDMTTDDLMKLTRISVEYNATNVGTEVVSGRNCYVLKLVPKPNADVIWGQLKLWIDTKNYIQMKSVFYDEDIEPVNTVEASQVKLVGGKTIATKIVVTPHAKEGHSTTVTYRNVEFNSPINTTFFTKGNMPQVKP